jgi:hypothetical protein
MNPHLNHCEHVAAFYWKRYTGNNTNAGYFRFYGLWRTYSSMAHEHGHCV